MRNLQIDQTLREHQGIVSGLHRIEVVEPVGIEPATYRLQSGRSAN
jgi:hypothetical protein